LPISDFETQLFWQATLFAARSFPEYVNPRLIGLCIVTKDGRIRACSPQLTRPRKQIQIRRVSLMTSNSDWNSATSGTVVAYFTSGEDAQRAINELMDGGFSIKEIGAAFHSASTSSFRDSAAAQINDNPPSTIGSVGSGSGISGATSDTSGVTPSGLSTGAGTVTSGAGRPGPIPGSEIPDSLPTNIPSTLKSSTAATLHDDPINQSRVVRDTTVIGSYPATGTSHEHTDEGASWWDKLKHLFSGEQTERDVQIRREAVGEKGSSNFGTGEGHLGTYPEFDYPLYGSAFESSFTSMGIPSEHAQRLAAEIGRGGAIVTVNAGLRNTEAESILERNHGRIRYEAEAFTKDETRETGPEAARIRVFGHVQRVYPSHIPGYEPEKVRLDLPTRRAS
jgi:hypothetical protein